MRRLAAALLLASLPVWGAAPPLPAYEQLPPGRYAVELSGMICTVCARAIAAEWGRLPEMEKASVDFDAEKGEVLVRLDKTLRAADLRKALRRAERLAGLDARYEIKSIAYVP